MAVTEDEEFWLAVLARLNRAHVAPDLFQQAVEPALDWFARQDLASLEDGPKEVDQPAKPDHLRADQRDLLVRLMAASTALDLMERLTLGLPTQMSMRLGMVFLRVGIAKLAGQRLTITDILREDAAIQSPSPGWPEGKLRPTFTSKTIRNSYIDLETAGLLKTEAGQDSDGRNRYLRLTDDGEKLFASVTLGLL